MKSGKTNRPARYFLAILARFETRMERLLTYAVLNCMRMSLMRIKSGSTSSDRNRYELSLRR